MKISNSTINYANTRNTTKQQNFGGVYSDAMDVVAKPLSKYLTFVGDKGSKQIAKFSNLNNAPKHLMTLESFIITGVYMGRTAKNKKIEKEQKFPMMLNDFLVTAFATIIGYAVDNKINKQVGNIVDAYKNAVKNNTVKASNLLKGLDNVTKENIANAINKTSIKKGAEGIIEAAKDTVDKNAIKEIFTPKNTSEISESITKALSKAESVGDGIKALKSIAIFGFIYRYLGPVLMTPIANNLSSKIQNKKKAKKAAEQTPPQQQTPPAPANQQTQQIKAKA